MANPTTNYGFVLPTSTDLVTDLPADFDVALQGVDTRLKALQPGTTAGDLFYASATANTNTRLGIGSISQVLTVTGGVPVWATPAGGDENWSLVSTTATTSGTSFTITGLGTYKQLVFYFDRISTATGGTALTCRFNSSSTANYTDFGLRADGTAVVAENRNNSGTEFTLFGSDTAAGRMTGYLSVTGAQTTGFKFGQFVGAGGATASNVTQVKGFLWENAATISSILVTTVDGYTFDAGSIKIYGSTN